MTRLSWSQLRRAQLPPERAGTPSGGIIAQRETASADGIAPLNAIDETFAAAKCKSNSVSPDGKVKHAATRSLGSASRLSLFVPRRDVPRGAIWASRNRPPSINADRRPLWHRERRRGNTPFRGAKGDTSGRSTCRTKRRSLPTTTAGILQSPSAENG